MKTYLNAFRLLALSLACFISCNPHTEIRSESVKPEPNSNYVTPDGLWKCTPQTALHFGDLSMEPVIHISGSITGELHVQACFSWKDGLFYDYWLLDDIRYDEDLGELLIQDQDGSTYMGELNASRDSIFGTVYSGWPDNLVPEDKLDFIRAEDLDYEKLFVPVSGSPDGSIRHRYEIPAQLNDGITTGSIYPYLTDPDKFTTFQEEVIRQEYGRLESLLILKDRKLVVEEYYYGFDREKIHNTHSCTKSIVSLLAGKAMTDHGRAEVEQAILSFFPELNIPEADKVGKISLKHVLTMSAGFSSDESYFSLGQDSIPEFILSLALESEPGEKFRYNSECPYLLGSIINALTGKTVDDYAREKLFDPLGISNYRWEKENGVVHCHSDLHLIPRDMVKIGMLVLNQGKWGDQQLLPEAWISESTRPHISESDFFDYGYQWWFRSAQNKSWWMEDMVTNESEHDMVLALGFGGQYIFIIRDLDLVVVTTSSDYNEGTGMSFMNIPMVIDKIVPLFE